MYSKIDKENGVLIRFDDRDLVEGDHLGDSEYTIPNGIKIIYNRAFENSKITNVIIPDSVKIIGRNAFVSCHQLRDIEIPQSVDKIYGGAFLRCENLKSIKLPVDTFLNLSDEIFGGCSSLETITIGNRILQVADELQNNFSECYPFIQYALKNNKFIPDTNIILNTNPNEIENFYKHSKRWQAIFNRYDKVYGVKDKENELGYFALHNAKNNLYQLCVILGVFQNHTKQEWEKLSEFIEQNIFTLEPNILHRMCSSFNVRTNGYNEEFAKFFIKNYTPPHMEDDVELCFMERFEVKENDIPPYALTEAEYEMYTKPQVVGYIGRVYRNWDKVKLAYLNRTVLNHREHASGNNSLTVDDVIDAVKITNYDNVDEDNEEMARVVGIYGYTQQEFEELQNIWNVGKIITPEQMILNIEEDKFEGKGIKYELLAKDNSEGLILGEKTNCCQVINGAGKSCVEYGVTKPNSGFIKFTLGEELIAKSWVWYNDFKDVICLDNIEIPTIWLNKFKKNKNLTKSFVHCLIRLANGFINEMKKNGYEVREVMVGAGMNDLEGLDKFEKYHIYNKVLPSDYIGYSDAVDTQYEISGVKFESLYEEGVTL